MRNKFAKQMERVSTEELNKIVNSKNGDYVEEVIEAAKEELDIRNKKLKRTDYNFDNESISDSINENGYDTTLSIACDILTIISGLILISGMIATIYYLTEEEFIYSIIYLSSTLTSSSMFYIISRCGLMLLEQKNN